MMPHSALPLSRFEPRPFDDHPAGSLLIITPYRSKPSKLCLAMKLSGLLDNQKEVAAALVIQGTPYGDAKEWVGEILRDVDYGSRSLAEPVLGLHCPMRVDVQPTALSDQSQQRSWRAGKGCLAIGAFGARLCGGAGENHYSWGKAIKLDDWSIDDTVKNIGIAALIGEWTLVLDLDDAPEVRIPVVSQTFTAASS